MPLLRHLEELRQRIFRALAALVVATLFSFVFADRLVDFLATPIGGLKALVSIEITENIAVFMRVSLLGGVILAMPVILYQGLRFILPGLTDAERRWLPLGVLFASLLFVGGVAFTWTVMLPAAVPFLIHFMGITTQVRPSDYFQFTTSLMFWIGLSFEMPLVILLLARLKWVTAAQLLRHWRQALVAVAVVAAVITPTSDPLNMALVMLPLGALYAIGIVVATLAGRRRDG